MGWRREFRLKPVLRTSQLQRDKGRALEYIYVHSVRSIQTQEGVERNLTADSIWGTVPLEAVVPQSAGDRVYCAPYAQKVQSRSDRHLTALPRLLPARVRTTRCRFYSESPRWRGATARALSSPTSASSLLLALPSSCRTSSARLWIGWSDLIPSMDASFPYRWTPVRSC